MILSQVLSHIKYMLQELADPHGTHRICLNIIFESIEQLKKNKFMKNCWVWLYRGAWQEYEVDEIENGSAYEPRHN